MKCFCNTISRCLCFFSIDKIIQYRKGLTHPGPNCQDCPTSCLDCPIEEVLRSLLASTHLWRPKKMHRFVDTVPCLPNGETRLLPSPKNHPEREKSHFIFFFFIFHWKPQKLYLCYRRTCKYTIINSVVHKQEGWKWQQVGKRKKSTSYTTK